jgi:predicted AAA+ superfamily ATPase
MLQTIRDACQFDPKAIDYALSDQIESLEDLVGHSPEKADACFRKTFVTGGMRTLLRQGLQRLAGASGQAVFELKQAMGGGKTHSMLALGYLGANPALARHVPKDIIEGFTPAKSRVVAISGRSISRDKHLWGDIADQLGKAPAFAEFFKGAPIAPNEKDWMTLLGDGPALILLDELPPYFANAVTQPVGQGTLAEVTVYALSNLLAAALKLKRLCIVISNLAGSYDAATKQIATTIQRAIKDLQNETSRQAKGITPVDLGSNEIYQILRKRLLTEDPAAATVNAAADAFSKSISEAVRSRPTRRGACSMSASRRRSYRRHGGQRAGTSSSGFACRRALPPWKGGGDPPAGRDGVSIHG